MNARKILLSLLCTTGSALGAAAIPAMAQMPDASPAKTARQAEGGLQDIVVTARKRTESTQDVPVAVTALSAEQIARYDLTNLEKIAASTPQFVVGRSAVGSGAQLVLRGIGSNSSSIGIEQSVAVVVDGAYYGQGRIINEGFFDLERAEILKGPQALFFGKNATAGVVSLTSASPKSKPEFLTRVAYDIKSENLIGEFIGSGPITDTLGVRVALRGSKMFGGYFRNNASPTTYTTTNDVTGLTTIHQNLPAARDAPGTREFIGRATLLWEPTDRFTANLKASANINNSDIPAWNFVLFNCPTGRSARNAAIPCGRNFNINQSHLPSDIGNTVLFGRDGKLGNRYKSWQVTSNLEYRGESITLTSVTNYNWNKNHYICDCDFTVTDLPSNFGMEKARFHAFSTEARVLTSFDAPINAMVGVYYQSSRRKYDSGALGGGFDNPNAPDPRYRYLTNVKDSATDGETIALFGQAIWKIIPELELASGVRYTHETKDSYFQHPYARGATFRAGVKFEAEQTFNNWSPEVTLTYKPSRDVTIYGGYKTAYKSGGFSNSGILSPTATVDDFTFDPETVKGFEGGIKTTMLDRQLRLNLAAYRYHYSNLQIDFFNSPIFAFSTINAGSVVTKGVELDFEFAPRAVTGLSLRGSINYNKARYGSFPNAPCYTGQSIAAGCTTIVPRPQQDLQGKPTAMAPEWTGSLGVSYDAPLGDSFILGLSADARYSDSYLSSSFGNASSRQKSYTSIDASARLSTEDGQWELAVIGKNLTNTFYVTGQYDGPLTGSGTGTANAVVADQVGFAALPRTVMVQLSWKY